MNQQPNILLVLSDQHNAKVVGHAGHPDVQTRYKLVQKRVKTLRLHEVDLGEVAKWLDGFTPVQIKEVFSRAVLDAVDVGQVDKNGKALITSGILKHVIDNWS